MSFEALIMLAKMSGYLTLEQRVDVVRMLRHPDVITEEVADAAIAELKSELRAAEAASRQLNALGRRGVITPTGIAPPREHLELGDHVSYHHRACAARRVKQEYVDQPYWVAVGPGRNNWWGGWNEENLDPLRGISTAGSRNKTVIVWHEEGSGVLIGMIRRGIGQSVRTTTGFNGESYEQEPGYFGAEAWVWLYAIKHSLSSLDFVLAPIWATRRDHGVRGEDLG